MRFSLCLRPVFLLAAVVLAHAQSSNVPNLLTAAIDENQLVTLTGNTHPLAKPAFDKGAAPVDLPMERMLLVLKRSPQQEAALAKLLADQQTPGSPDYHHWLTPQEFGQRFGVSDQDLGAITAWLQSHGFTVNNVSNGRTLIEFSGNAAQVEYAFHTPIHQFVINGESHWANAQDPQLPMALAPAVAGVASFSNFISKPQVQFAPQKVQAHAQGGINPPFTSGSSHYLAPGDYATIYNINPVFSSGITGSGVVIGVVGRTNIHLQDIVNFRSVFGLSNNPPNIIVNGTDPGDLGGGEELEAVLDTSWSGATAPGATVDLVVSKTTNSTDGVILSEEYIIDNNLANVMTESFGECEADYTSSGASAISSMAQQAASQGITYLVSSGDSGSAGCDNPNTETSASGPLSVNMLASTPYNVAVGGTQFNESNGTYWNSSNSSTGSSALSYIPEDVWNANCTGATCGTVNILAGGGGSSVFFSKPSWQSGVTGIPSDGARDVPDVSLTAAGHDPYLVCLDGSCANSNQIQFQAVYGTSASAPSFAGIMALVNQKTGSRQGQANPVLYALAATETLANCNASNTSALPASSCIFNDVTVGTNAVPGETNYNTQNETYPATVGYDLASGLGSVNVANLVNSWATVNPITVSPSSGSGSTPTFTFTFTASNQAQEHMLFSTSLSAHNACYLYYSLSSNTLNLLSDQGSGSQSAALGSGATISNSQCSVAVNGVSVSQTGSTVTITVPITFSAAFSGTKNIYGNVVNMSGQAGTWLQVGTWTVPTSGSNAFSVSPASGNSSVQTFTFTFTAANQAQEHMLFNSSTSAPNSCYLYYSLSLKTLYLLNDAGNSWQSATPDTLATMANSQCSVAVNGVTISQSDNTVTITVPITFSSAFGGAKNIYATYVNTSNKTGTWQQVGTWTVPASSNTFSVNPPSGSGTASMFTFTFTAASQAQEHMMFNTSLSAASSCYLYYYLISNTLSLLNDVGNSSQSAALNAGGTLSNSQCSVAVNGVSVLQSGNTVTIKVPITFSSSFTGAKNTYANIVTTPNQPGIWQQVGTWTR